MEEINTLTCVTCFYSVKNKHNNKYLNWFNNSLKIDCPYIVFSDKRGIELIKSFRDNLPTYYIELDITDFETYKFKGKMKTDPTHCPSIELNLIWNEKIYLLNRASNINPFNSNFFQWIDAGVCIYRDIKPPLDKYPNQDKLDKLPKNKFIYSSSNKYVENSVRTNNYYHHISGTYILHKSIIPIFIVLYTEYMNKLVDVNNIWTDQVILTHIYKDNKDLFYKLTDGYGEIVRMMF